MNFIEKYFIEPTIKQSGYNIVNTMVYSLLFILIMLTMIEYFKKSRIRLNKKVWFELLPFVFLGGILRTLFDLGFFSPLGVFQYFFITPLIYVTIFYLVFFCSIANFVFHPMFRKYVGLALSLFFGLVVLSFAKDIQLFLTVLFFSSSVYILLIFVLRLVRRAAIVKGINSHVVFGHILDACGAVVAVSKGYKESQILSAGLISVSPILFIFVKLLFPLVLLWYIEKTKGNTNFILKFALLILGLPQGLHTALLLLTA